MFHCRWISLGNQLAGVRLVDEGLRARYKAAFPDQVIQPPDPPSRTGGQENKTNLQDNDSSSTLTQTKSSPAALTQRAEIHTTSQGASANLASGIGSGDKAAAVQDMEMQLN